MRRASSFTTVGGGRGRPQPQLSPVAVPPGRPANSFRLLRPETSARASNVRNNQHTYGSKLSTESTEVSGTGHIDVKAGRREGVGRGLKLQHIVELKKRTEIAMLGFSLVF